MGAVGQKVAAGLTGVELVVGAIEGGDVSSLRHKEAAALAHVGHSVQ